MLDRLLHHAEVIAINGSSYRMKERRTESRTPSTLSDTARHAAGDLPTGV
ncbi:ATP-binding protein [Dictyobacter kobayashii]|nr:ATP-binding protein [Dictyobacter kobayashii]